MKNGWYEMSKGETPEKIIGFYEDEDYRTPSKVFVEPADPNQECYTLEKNTQDLHFMTKEVMCVWGNKYRIDKRRKFDSMNEWIWHSLEGCDVELWRPLPKIK